MEANVHHRTGPLKQKNKSHKTGRHRSKGAIDNAVKGRVSLKSISHKHKKKQCKANRRNQVIQIRKNKLEDIVTLKSRLGGQNTAPFLVCILPMHLGVDPMSALSILKSCDVDATSKNSSCGVTYIDMPRLKQRFAFVIPPIGHGNEVTVLDYLKVCDTTLILTSAITGEDDIFDKWGHNMFNMISSQGIPSPIVALMDLESVNPKRRQSVKVGAQKFVSKLLPNEKIMKLDTNMEGLHVMRRIGSQKRNTLHNRDNRPYLFGDKVEFISKPDLSGDYGILKVTGYLRGTPLDINGLVHVTGLGDFQMSEIEIFENRSNFEISESFNKKLCLKIVADLKKQTPLKTENIPDVMDSEQIWPIEEDIAENQTEGSKTKLIKRVPKGWSDYQAAWIPETEMIETEIQKPKGTENKEDSENDEDEYMSCENESSKSEVGDGIEDNDYTEAVSISDVELDDDNYDLQMDLHEEQATLRKIKDARNDEMWPDEIDTPSDILARTRFKKYRGLESFRTSPWDPKENYPSDYSRIYQFQNFDRSKRGIIAKAKDVKGVMPGSYITIYVSNVQYSKWSIFTSARQTENIILYGLLPHEHQMSVMNVVLKRIPNSEIPLKSKEKLIIQCGYRRFVVNPIFSQHTNGDKYKFERFFRPNSVVCATFFAPIQFSPAPVLAFKENPDSTLGLVARGFLLSCNPDRIILKRIVLSGHPARIHRKIATIRYMFFNKEDVEYFKPIKLRTKCGRIGHIKQSLGTHGHMKCYFDGQLLSYDTVFMYLYKRVYPKWTYSECLIGSEDDQKEESMLE